MREVTGVDGGTDLETGIRVELVDLVEDLVQGAHNAGLGSGEALAGVLQSGGEGEEKEERKDEENEEWGNEGEWQGEEGRRCRDKSEGGEEGVRMYGNKYVVQTFLAWF